MRNTGGININNIYLQDKEYRRVTMKIVVLEPLGVAEGELRLIAKNITDQGHELVIHSSRPKDNEELKARVKEAEILVLANMPLKKEVIISDEKLKMMSIAFTGVDHVDLTACGEKGAVVCNAAGYSTSSVAELTYGLILSVLRNIVPLDKKTREGSTKDGYSQNDLDGKTIGLIGTGAIGAKVAKIAIAFGCQVLAYSRSEKDELKSLGVKYVSLEEALANSDIISLHTPLNNETKGLINRERLALMKKTSILINTARGPIIDNEALADALKKGSIAGAGIDVFDMEPPLPKDYPLLDTPNTVVLPHIGFATKEAMVRRDHITFNNIEKWLQGKPQNVVSR
jgi:D-3-phosphoglycerate dehydrogenase